MSDGHGEFRRAQKAYMCEGCGEDLPIGCWYFDLPVRSHPMVRKRFCGDCAPRPVEGLKYGNA